MNSLNCHKNYLSFCSSNNRTLSTSLLHALPSFILSGTKRNAHKREAVVGMDLLKLVDNSIKAFFLSTVVPPVTRIRGLLEKPEVKTQVHSSVE